MRLHTSGVKLDKLGSLQDRVFREYMFKEAELESSKTEFLMYLALTNPTIEDNSKRAEWSKEINKSWKYYLSKLFVFDLPKENPEEEALKEFYDRVVAKAKLTIRKDSKTGKLELTGTEAFKD